MQEINSNLIAFVVHTKGQSSLLFLAQKSVLLNEDTASVVLLLFGVTIRKLFAVVFLFFPSFFNFIVNQELSSWVL
jgi:hypothetical protein